MSNEDLLKQVHYVEKYLGYAIDTIYDIECRNMMDTQNKVQSVLQRVILTKDIVETIKFAIERNIENE